MAVDSGVHHVTRGARRSPLAAALDGAVDTALTEMNGIAPRHRLFNLTYKRDIRLCRGPDNRAFHCTRFITLPSLCGNPICTHLCLSTFKNRLILFKIPLKMI